jgi:crotonobetainyl-CoA:carnitine CoA-transferase CaiB-like acyl-CoA transferase
MGFLDGISIIDATYGGAGPMAVHVLVDFGAAVLRIDVPGAQRTAAELVRLRGARSIAIDLGQEQGRLLALRLIRDADVLLSEPGWDGLEPLAWRYEDLSRENPALIWCRLSGHGPEGPLREAWPHDHLVAARYGVYDQPGFRPGPTFVTAGIPSLGASLLALQAIGAALYQRQRTGEGQEVAVSLLAGALAFQPPIVSASIDPPGGNPPPPQRRPSGAAPFYSLYECADGRYLHFGCLSPQFQRNAIAVLGLEAETQALGFGTPAGRDNAGRLIEIVAAKMREKTYAAWAAIFESADVPYAPAQWTEELLEDPQVAHEALLVTLDDPRVGPIAQMGPVSLVKGQDWRLPPAAPEPGQNTHEVCLQLGMSLADISALRRSGVIA